MPVAAGGPARGGFMKAILLPLPGRSRGPTGLRQYCGAVLGRGLICYALPGVTAHGRRLVTSPALSVCGRSGVWPLCRFANPGHRGYGRHRPMKEPPEARPVPAGVGPRHPAGRGGTRSRGKVTVGIVVSCRGRSIESREFRHGRTGDPGDEPPSPRLSVGVPSLPVGPHELGSPGLSPDLPVP
jgi:hypothetical protein